MTLSENIEPYGLHSADQYVEVLSSEFGAAKYPNQEHAYVLEQQPFYAPRPVDDHISILSFNDALLPDSPIQVIVDHPDLFADDILIRWMQEQNLTVEATLGRRGQLADLCLSEAPSGKGARQATDKHHRTRSA